MIRISIGKYLLPVLIVIFIWTGLNSSAQINRTKVLGGYIYNFAKLSSSAKQEKLPTYNIALVSDIEEIKAEFMIMEKELKVNNKDIVLTIAPDANVDYKSTCLIFVGADKSKYYSRLFNETKDFEVLLVSENYDRKREILLNLYETKDGKILFEINKGNIYERRIEINNEVLLMGGTEIDLVEMYLKSQKMLTNSEHQLLIIQNSLNELKQQIKTTEEEVAIHKAEIGRQKNESKLLTVGIQNYKAQLVTQKQAFTESEKRLKTFNDSLMTSKQELQKSKSEIVRAEEFLKKQRNEIVNIERELIQKNTVINRQRMIVIIFIIGLTIISFLTILLFKNFRDKKRKNMLLKEKQIEIYRINNQLAGNNKKIQDINNELKDKNEELTTTLNEMVQLQSQLVQSEKMASLGVLSAGIAHEINNPINFVYAGINSLLRDFQDIEPVINEVSSINPETDNLYEKIKKIQKLMEENFFDDAFEAIPVIIGDIKLGADRTAEIVKGLRSFSRVDKTELQPLNIHEGIDTSLLLLKNKYKTHIEIIKDYDEGIPLLKCYPGKINQAFLNIISNAIDSIDESGKIWITTSKQKENIIISIKDNGCGISNELKENLFDPFFTTKPVGKGTGLGLSISYGIIAEHGGKIDVKSESKKGSDFIITLPIK